MLLCVFLFHAYLNLSISLFFSFLIGFRISISLYFSCFCVVNLSTHMCSLFLIDFIFKFMSFIHYSLLIDSISKFTGSCLFWKVFLHFHSSLAKPAWFFYLNLVGSLRLTLIWVRVIKFSCFFIDACNIDLMANLGAELLNQKIILKPMVRYQCPYIYQLLFCTYFFILHYNLVPPLSGFLFYFVVFVDCCASLLS
jgi:hypothetical protein